MLFIMNLPIFYRNVQDTKYQKPFINNFVFLLFIKNLLLLTNKILR